MDDANRKERYFALEQEYAECEREEDKLREELAEVQALFNQKFAAVDERKRAIRIKQSPLAPIHTLCDDVLAQIIELSCAHEHRDCWVYRTKPPSQLPIPTLESIVCACRRFRTVAFALPDLWRCIHISDDLATPFGLDMQDYIRLTKSLTLRLNVMIGHATHPRAAASSSPPPVDTSLNAQKLLSFKHSWNVLQETTHRWESLNISATSKPEYVEVIRQSKPCELSALKQLHIRDSLSRRESFYESQFLRNTPNVTSFWTDRCNSRLTAGHLPNLTFLRLAPTKTLTVDCVTWSRILGPLVNLKKLALNLIMLRGSSSNATLKPILLPKLRHLRIDYSLTIDGQSFPAIAAPSLRILDVQSCTAEDLAKFVSATDALPHVQFVSLCGIVRIDTAAVSALLSLMPGVCSVHVKQRRLFSKIASILTDDPTLLPRLDTIHFSHRVESSSLVSFVKASIDAGRPLKKIVVTHIDVVEEMGKVFDGVNVVLESKA